jgi:hypothetical protein
VLPFAVDGGILKSLHPATLLLPLLALGCTVDESIAGHPDAGDAAPELADTTARDTRVEEPAPDPREPHPSCFEDMDCDDGDPCTLDRCEDGICTNTPQELALVSHDEVVATDTMQIGHPDVAWTGSEFGVLWSHLEESYPCEETTCDHDLYFRRVTVSGHPYGETVLVTRDPVTVESNEPTLVWTGSEFGASWRSYYEARFTRLDPAGTPLLDEVTVGTRMMQKPALAWTGSEFGMSWDSGPITFARLSPLGEVIGSTDISSATSVWGASSVVWTGSSYGIAWVDTRGWRSVHYTRVIPDGSDVLVEPISRLSDEPFAAQTPRLVWNGSQLGLIWIEGTYPYSDAYFMVLDIWGGVLSETERLTPEAGAGWYPDLVWTGSEYGALWSGAGVHARRVSADGVPVGAQAHLTDEGSLAAMAWTGSAFGVVWVNARLPGEEIPTYTLNFNVIEYCP